MAARTFKGNPVAPAQWFDLEPITDPEEIAALEEQIKRADEVYRLNQRREALELLQEPTVAEVLKLARRLTAEQRVGLITKLGAQLSPEKRREALEQLTTPSRNGTRRRAAKKP
jgi:hypothetical protein